MLNEIILFPLLILIFKLWDTDFAQSMVNLINYPPYFFISELITTVYRCEKNQLKHRQGMFNQIDSSGVAVAGDDNSGFSISMK